MPTVTERPPTLLNQVFAVRATVKTDTEQALTKHYHVLQRTELLKGFSRSYQPRDAEGFLYPSEITEVQVKAERVLREVAADMTRLFDVTAAMVWVNQYAKADVFLLLGETPVSLLSDVPVSYLMFLKKALVNIETVVRKLPTLDPTDKWTFDPATDDYRSGAAGTVKTAKVRRNHVLADATAMHPAQVESYTEDVPILTLTTVKASGMLPAQRVNTMLARIRTLLEAVKFAREQANLAPVVDTKPGRRVFDYLFAPDA